MVTIGFLLSLLRFGAGFGSITIDSNLILGIVVPPLMFEAAMRTRFEVFRTVQKTVMGLAIFGVVISAFVSALVLNVTLGLPFAIALLFGVIVSPTDPVTVVSLLRRVQAPERLTTILESEAYLNNATPVILFPIALSLSFNPMRSLSQFALILLGGSCSRPTCLRYG
jgi:CPA1 family monovalent cation:H+ antiporter